jgi:hypothetical protein
MVLMTFTGTVLEFRRWLASWRDSLNDLCPIPRNR